MKRRVVQNFAWVLVGTLAVTATSASGLSVQSSAAEASTNAAASPAAVVATAPAASTGWTTMFADDFTGAAGSPVSSKWFAEQGTWGTGAVDTTTDSTANIFVDGEGHLSIRALQDSSGKWTSGRIITSQKDFAAPEGGQLLMTASIKQPNPEQATGYWPAFWALGLDASGNIDWPRSGEIDMLEAVNGDSQVFQTLHCDLADAGACNEPYGMTSGPQPCDGCLTGYHTYSALIDRTVPGKESVQFMVDGVVRYTVEEASVGAAAWAAAIPNAYFLILNLAIGGGLPNGACGCDSAAAPKTSGGTMSIDHVAVYQKAAPTQQVVTSATPIISGVEAVGSTLTAEAGSWAPSDVTLSYVWQRNGTAIPGATGQTYTLTSADAGAMVTVSVTGSKTGYVSATSTSSAKTVEKLLAATPVPVITGTNTVGSTLTAVAGDWKPAPVTLTYQWKRNGSSIAGATGSTYSLTSADAGTQITVSVTGRKSGYTTVTKTSSSLAVQTRPLAATPVPVITGTNTVGSTLTAVAGDWKPAPVTLTYQWKRNGSSIAGATGSTYSLTSADAGTKITVSVTGRKSGYTTATKTSSSVTIR